MMKVTNRGEAMIDRGAILTYQKQQRVIFGNEDCLYIKPHPALQLYVSNYTLTFPTKTAISDHYTVIPHGCATMIFGIKGQELDSQLFGPATQAVRVGDQAAGFDQILIVEFQPAGLHAFLGFHQHELTDQLFPLELLHAKIQQGMRRLLEKAESMQELVMGVDQLFLKAISKPSPSEVTGLTRSIVHHRGNISLKQLSKEAFYSERHLTRLFNEYLGMSTKTFSRLVRINHALRLLNDPSNGITKIHEATGYYDVSHFNREFKQITGNTPQGYRQKMSDFYSEIAKF